MKKSIIILSFILVILPLTMISYKLVNANIELKAEQDIIAVQSNKEIYLTPYGYTIDNPNIIVNPYGISPLTAIILFETPDYQMVTITIHGKDQNSTYTNTFESQKRHYIPIYGLYPNTTNKIDIKSGEQHKTIEIKTEPLPIELTESHNIENNTNNLTFITTDNYPYAVDNNNDIRWYLTKNYSKQITYLENGHLLLSDEILTETNQSHNLVEIDLLGKIYKHYILDTPYLGTYQETSTSLIINSTSKIEIDKQTGTILNKQNTSSHKVKYSTNQDFYQSLLPLYATNKDISLVKGLKINLTTETKQSQKNIFVIGYKEPDNVYKQYNIKFIKTKDNLQITGQFNNKENIYLILDKFLDKKVYDLTNNYTIINKEGLSGKYSIYISINGDIYKTNNYIIF